MKKIIAYCDGGLGNRINSLIGAIFYSKLLSLELEISWPLNRWCSASFEDIFESSYKINQKSILELNNEIKNYSLIAHARQLFVTDFFINPNVVMSKDIVMDWCTNALKSRDIIIYYNSLVPFYISIYDIDAAIGSLRVLPVYKQRAQQYLKEIGLVEGKYWGVHLRGTDAGFGHIYYNFWLLLTRLLPGSIILCTDDLSIQEMFKSNPKIFCRIKNSLPTKASTLLGWNDKCVDEYGREFNYNIMRDSDAVKDSLIDFVILGSSKLLYTSQSTFLDNAKRFSNSSRRWPSFIYLLIFLRFQYRIIRIKLSNLGVFFKFGSA